MKAYYDANFAAPLGDSHIMPMAKFAEVAEAASQLPGVTLERPSPLNPMALLEVHTPDYVEAVRSGEPRELAESQKFPWTPALFPSVLLTNGAVLAAGRAALQEGCAAALASGFHHAHADHGEGFCTFNGLVLCADRLVREGVCERVAVLDCDLHYGNGTASLAESRPHLRAISVFGNDYWNNQAFRDVTVLHHVDGANHRSFALPAGCNAAQHRAILDTAIAALFEAPCPDLVLFQAGADPFREDPYSPLDLGAADLAERDATVFESCRRRGVPVAWVLAGGYCPDRSKIVAIHLNTVRAACAAFAPSTL